MFLFSAKNSAGDSETRNIARTDFEQRNRREMEHNEKHLLREKEQLCLRTLSFAFLGFCLALPRFDFFGSSSGAPPMPSESMDDETRARGGRRRELREMNQGFRVGIRVRVYRALSEVEEEGKATNKMEGKKMIGAGPSSTFS